ncbi:MAG: tetratricopeptide repeat protein [Nitrospiraceae bacterium]|nr:tetratricopeptide repeat protein [Nitrospiraceae bacterium]
MRSGVFVLTILCMVLAFSVGCATADKCSYYVQQNEFDTAMIVCSDDIDKFNSNKRKADTYINRGIVYIGKNDYTKAIADFTKAIELDPEDASYYIRRGKAYSDKDQHADAIPDFSKAISLKPNDETVYNLRGMSYLAKGDKESASADFKKAVQLNPKYTWPYYRIASIYARDKKADDTCVWLKKAADAGFDKWDYLKNDGWFEGVRASKCYKEFISGK